MTNTCPKARKSLVSLVIPQTGGNLARRGPPTGQADAPPVSCAAPAVRATFTKAAAAAPGITADSGESGRMCDRIIQCGHLVTGHPLLMVDAFRPAGHSLVN